MIIRKVTLKEFGTGFTSLSFSQKQNQALESKTISCEILRNIIYEMLSLLKQVLWLQWNMLNWP